MEAPRSISKTNASFPEYLSFKGLRELGIRHCQALGSDLWTDFNLHDPGLTILETLCYALTDLGYRTNFPIEDLVARSPGQKICDKAAATGSGALCAKTFDDNFFTPEQILTCNPVTMLDLRKLLIDIPGVKNAWVERADAAELKLYLDRKSGTLQYEVPEDLVGDDTRTANAVVSPDGLYVVHLELDGDEEADACGHEAVPVDRILADAWTLLHSHRNLCEDFIDIVILGDEEIAICADIEIDPAALPDDVLLAIHQKLDVLLSPEPTFYTLQEMLARGKRIEEIYAGRPLTPLAKLVDAVASGSTQAQCSHGFIDTEELIATERRTQLHTSDLYREILAVPGVLAVRKLLAVNYVNGLPQTRGEKWCLRLTPKYRQRFDLERSHIRFFKGLLPFSADNQTVAQRYKEEREARTKAPLAEHQLDLPVPEGTYRDLQDYRSIVHELPLIYGIGDGGIPDSATAERKAQVRQLRAYLLFYDQILANYLAQLANLRELFSIRPDRDRSRNRTYFTQILRDIPEIEALLENYNRCEAEEGYPPVPENYPDYLDYLVESRETYHARRNRFLDHLLARFAESFTDYVLLMFDVNGKRNDEDRIIRDKTSFLSTYPETSRNRGKGFDYNDRVVWDTNNVSGLEKRVARLLGLGNANCRATPELRERVGEPFLRRTLSNARVVEIEGAWRWVIELPGPGNREPVTLTSRSGYRTKSDARKALAAFRELASDERSFRRLVCSEAGLEHHGFAVVGPDQVVLAEADSQWPDAETRDLYLYRLLQLAIGGSVRCELGRATECFFYRLLDAQAETVLLEGTRGYPTASDAHQAFEGELLSHARDVRSYRDLDGADGFGFEVLSQSGNAVLATHPHRYATAEERSLRKRAILFHLNHPEIRTRIDGEPGAFGFEVRDGAGEVLLQSAIRYAAREEAEAACQRLLEHARHRASYRARDAHAEKRPFGFDLIGDGGEALARHSSSYETPGARDLAISLLIRQLWPPEHLRFEIREQKGAYMALLLAEDETELLLSAAGYETEDEAHEVLGLVIEVAGRADRYVAIDDDGAYGFVLHDEAREVLAVHPATYAQAEERDLAQRGITGYVSPASVSCSVVGEPGRFHAFLLDPGGAELLRSAENYPDEASARSGLDELLDFARDQGRYRRIDAKGSFGFELWGDACPVAEHAGRYATSGEREAAIAMIIAYVRRAEIQRRIDNPTGAFRFDLRDESGEPVLSGTEVFSSLRHAEAAYESAVALARDRRRYHRTADGPCGCPFGFAIVDEHGAVVAEHPRHYATAEQRKEAIKALYALLHDGSTLADVVLPAHEHGFFYQLVDFDGDILLRSDACWPSAEEAEEAFEKELAPLAQSESSYARIYDNEKCTYSFGLRVPSADPTPCVPKEGLLLAMHSRDYALPRERDEQLQRTIDLVRSRAPADGYPGVGCGHYFRLVGDGYALVSTAYYPDPARAASACTRLLARLTVPDAYAIEEVGESLYRLVVSTDDDAVSAASAPVEHDKAVAMREALRAMAAEDVALPHRLEETRSEYHCRLTDSRGDTLLESAQGTSAEIWATMDGLERAAQREEAIHRTRDAFSNLDDPPQFHTEQIDGDYYFRFDLDGGTVLRSRWSYRSEKAAAEAAKELRCLPAVDDNYRARDLGPRNFGLEILDKKRAEANREKACEACNRLVEAAQDPDAFRLVTDAERCAHGFELIDADGGTLARHRRLFANEKERDDTIRAIQCLAGAEGFHLVEHLLLRPKQTEEPRDALIPLGGGCRDADGNLCPAGADPYSFRVTVVVPYWPRRFRHADFRPFFERTLRLETPAHILPRICWVDVCQMQAFEDTYRRWLRALASPEDDCDRASAQNELVQLLFSLKSLYGTARLFGCTGDGVTNPLRLDQTILGTAGTDHGDFS